MRRANTIIDWSYPADSIFSAGAHPLMPCRGAYPVYWWVDDVLEHKGWLMPTVKQE